MSRTRKRMGTSSPITKYVSFSAGTGMFSYYDKEAKERVEFETLTIIPLDLRYSVTGYSDSMRGSISSNMVKSSGKEEMNVFVFTNKSKTDLASGLYKDIKDKVNKAGGKYTANILALADVGDGEELINLQLSGISLSSWMDFQSEHPNDGYYDYSITITKGQLSKRADGETVPVTKKEEAALEEKLKKNARAPRPVWFYLLSFDTVELTSDELERATEEDEKLQEYFDSASSKSEDTEEETSFKGKGANKKGSSRKVVEEEDEDDDEESGDLPF